MRTAKDADLETYDMEWEDGVNAYHDGKLLTDNPHDDGGHTAANFSWTRPHLAWKRGWLTAQAEDWPPDRPATPRQPGR